MGVGTDIVLCQLINMSVRSRWLQPGNWWVWVGIMVGPTPARGNVCRAVEWRAVTASTQTTVVSAAARTRIACHVDLTSSILIATKSWLVGTYKSNASIKRNVWFPKNEISFHGSGELWGVDIVSVSFLHSLFLSFLVTVLLVGAAAGARARTVTSRRGRPPRRHLIVNNGTLVSYN